MKNPNPSDTTSTGMPAARAASANGDERPASWGWAAAFALSASGSAVMRPTSQAISLREPTSPASYAATCDSQSAVDELGHERVGHVGLGDGPVVVDEERDRRRAGGQRRHRQRRSRAARSAGRAAGSSRDGTRPASRATPGRIARPPGQPHAEHDDRAAHDLRRARPARRGSSAPRITAPAGTRNWIAVTRVGPTSRIALNTNTLAMPAASAPAYTIASDNRRRERRGSARSRPPTAPNGASTIAPPTTVQAVAGSGSTVRRIRAPAVV